MRGAIKSEARLSTLSSVQNSRLTVVFMMPVPCVRIELAMWRILMVFRCLLLLDFSTKIFETKIRKIQSLNFLQNGKSTMYMRIFMMSRDTALSTTVDNVHACRISQSVRRDDWLPDAHLVVDVVHKARHKHVDVAHDLQHVETLQHNDRRLKLSVSKHKCFSGTLNTLLTFGTWLAFGKLHRAFGGWLTVHSYTLH